MLVTRCFSKRMKTDGFRSTGLCAGIVLWLMACTGAGPVYEQFDEGTSVNVSYSQPPLVLSRETPGYGAYARNFIQLGAIEVNRSGNYLYFLWLGIWNTDQVGGAAEHRDGFESIVLFVDGEPLLLDNAGWTQAALGVSAAPYAKPVASSVDAYYRVTPDQLRRLSNATDIGLQSNGVVPRRFELWDEQRVARRNLAAFVERVTQ